MKCTFTRLRAAAHACSLPLLLTLALGLVALARPLLASAARDASGIGDIPLPTLNPFPPPPGYAPELRGSYKVASQHRVGFDDPLTYTVRLHNRGTLSATVDVNDPVPTGMNYVDGSATGGGTYDLDTRTVSFLARSTNG